VAHRRATLLEFFWGIDEVGWDGLPRDYEPIQEIDLEAFDFEGFIAERDEAAARMRAAAAGRGTLREVARSPVDG
jgi:hypothetical protein